MAPGLQEVDSLPPSANHDLTKGNGSKLLISGPLTFTNISLDHGVP